MIEPVDHHRLIRTGSGINGIVFARQMPPTDQPADHNGPDLTDGGRNGEHQHRGGDRYRCALAIRAQVSRHAPHRLGHDSDRNNFQSMEPSGVAKMAEGGDAVAEQDQRERGRRCESNPGGECPGIPARNPPTMMPTLLLAGPGRNWLRATTSA